MMEWSNPELVEIGSTGRGIKDCKNGVIPKSNCISGGEDYIMCWPGGAMPSPQCMMGEMD